MQAMSGFPGAQSLIGLIDAALEQADVASITASICRGLDALLDSGRLVLPSAVFESVPGHHARRLLYRSEEHGYVVTAMTWGPGQRSPIHDHAGAWGVESVVSGRLDETRYGLRGNASGYWCLERGETECRASGNSASLIPQHDYHAVHNPSDHDTAVTLNIYSRDLSHCRIFDSRGDDWYAWRLGRLSYDPWPSRGVDSPRSWIAAHAGAA